MRLEVGLTCNGSPTSKAGEQRCRIRGISAARSWRRTQRAAGGVYSGQQRHAWRVGRTHVLPYRTFEIRDLLVDEALQLPSRYFCREGKFFGEGKSNALHGALARSKELKRWLDHNPRLDEDPDLDDIVANTISYLMREKLRKTNKKIVGDKSPFTSPGVVRRSPLSALVQGSCT